MGFGDTSKKDKASAKGAAAADAAKKAAEDASWADGDKGSKAKSDRAAAKAAAADDKLARKQEAKALEAAEEEAVSQMKGANKQQSTKLTQAEISRRQALAAMMGAGKAAPKKKTTKSETVAQAKLEENTNRQTEVVSASGIDAALSALEGGEKKQKKMTYKEYEAQVLPQIQADNPDLKMSQAKDKAFKMWERAPENPKNQEK